MPEEEKIKSSQKSVDIDTSGPEVDVAVEEKKVDTVITEEVTKEATHEETKQDSPEPVDTSKESDVQPDVQDSKQEETSEDTKLEEYSRGVQGRIAKLTRKMREAERREAAGS